MPKAMPVPADMGAAGWQLQQLAPCTVLFFAMGLFDRFLGCTANPIVLPTERDDHCAHVATVAVTAAGLSHGMLS